MDPFGFCVIRTQTDSSGNDSVPEDLRILNFFLGGGGGGDRAGKPKQVNIPAAGRGNTGKNQELFVVLVTLPFCWLSSFLQKTEFLLGGIKTFCFFKIC